MQLKAWIHREGRKPAWLAEKLGVPIARAYRLLNDAEPHLWEVVKLQEITNFEVDINDFLTQQQKDKING